MLNIFGVCAVTFMVLMYALERRNPIFILTFAFGCAMSSAYGFLAGAWPLGAAETVWTLIAVNRYRVYGSTFEARRDVAGGADDARPRLLRGRCR